MAKKCDCKSTQVERWIRRNDLTFGDVDFVDGTTQIPSITGGVATWPGSGVVDAYIEGNIDYETLTGTQTGLDVGNPTANANETDSRALVFQTFVAPGEAPTVSWTFVGEGFIRIEINKGRCGCWELLDEFYGEGSGPQQALAVLPEGMHEIRVTNVDIGGAQSVWTYNGDDIEVAPVSEAAIVERAVIEVDCCGNVRLDGSAFRGTLLDFDEITEIGCPDMCKRLGETLVPSEVGDPLVAARPAETSTPPVGVLHNPTGATIVLDADPAIGDTAFTDELVIRGFDGCDIPVRVTAERVTAGGNAITFRNNSVFFSPGASDQNITIESLPDCFGTVTPLAFAVWAGSIGPGEALIFNADNPVTSFAQGAGGQNISGALPYVGAWNNNNNNATSAFGFAPTTVFTFRKNGQANIGASMVFGAVQVPECVDFKLCDLPCLIDERIQEVKDLARYPIYRYADPAEPGFRTRWWNDTAGPHLDPLEWAGPADDNGFPLPTADAPDLELVVDAANVNDSVAGAGQTRYSIIDGWFFLDQPALVREVNGNTGEFGMVLHGSGCCGGTLIEAAGGNHTGDETDTVDPGVMDPTQFPAGWSYFYSPMSDNTAFHGLQLQFSVDNGATWAEIPVRRPTMPAVEVALHPSAEPIPDGWQLEPLDRCCDFVYEAPEAAPVGAAVLCSEGTLSVDPGQNVNDTGAIATAVDALDAGWSTPAAGQLEFAGSPDKVKIHAHVHQSIAQGANIQRPAPVLELYRNGTLITSSATGYIRDFSDHEESSNTIVWSDRAPGANPLYEIRSRQDALAAVVSSVSGQFSAEACTSI